MSTAPGTAPGDSTAPGAPSGGSSAPGDPTAPRTGADRAAIVDGLLAALDPLAYPERMRALAAWTRARAGAQPAGQGSEAPELDALLPELASRGLHGRRLAAVAASVARDARYLEARLADPDPTVRAHALKAALHLPISDAALERAMADDAPEAVRRQVAATVVAGGRTALAERLIAVVRAQWGDTEAARLLPGCGPAVVERLLPALFPAVVRWRALARRHPDLVLDEVARQLAALPEQSRTAWWQRNADILEATAELRPPRVLDLLERHCPPHLPGPVIDCLGPLLRAAPGRTIALVTAPERLFYRPASTVSRTALGRLARLAPPELLDLGRAWSRHPHALALLLRALPPSRREDFYDAVTAGLDLAHTALAPAILDALPRRRAQAEARRMAAQAAEAGKPWHMVLSSVAHLPVAEARERLLAAVRRPAADDRALAYPLLVRNAARSGDPAAVAVLLADLQRLRNEQDPVRSAALAALAEVPPRLLAPRPAPDAPTTPQTSTAPTAPTDTSPAPAPAPVPAPAPALLHHLTTDAIEARDSSPRTRGALSTLALATLREHAGTGEHALLDWALTTLTRLSGHTGGADLGSLGTTLRKGQEFQVFEALRPWLEAGADKVDHSLTFALARALGRRARHMPELQELLWQAVQFGNDTTVRQAVDLWLDAPATRDERVARLLESEPSAAVLHPVLRVLAHRRTDLLDPVLADPPPYGRFLSRGTQGTRWMPPLDGVRNWLPRQQQAAARLLSRAAADPARPTHQRAQHIRAMAAIPELGFDAVRRHLDSPHTVLAEAALGALAWTDRPADALPLLLAHAADDRARVALYAAGRVTARLAPSHLETTLRAALLPAADGGPAPAAKVTSRKELVRLTAARLPVTTAAQILAEAYAVPGQHRDVQAACVPVAAGLLPAPAAWSLLESAADGPPVVQAALLRVTPYDLPSAQRPRYARLVGAVTQSADKETADAATSLLARWYPWYRESAPLLLTATTDLANRTSWRAAADGLVALAATTDGPLLQALAQLTAAEAESTARHLDAEADRDRPARRRVDHLVSRLSTAVTMRQGEAYPHAARAAAQLLRDAEDFLPSAIHLTTTALDLDAPASRLLPALDALAADLTDLPALAATTAARLRSRLSTAARPGDPHTLLLATDRLTATPTYPAALLALALTEALGTRTTWPPEWRTPLRTLRRHPHPDIRAAALTLATAPE
ncbi:hypothetical protein [Actinacidiphila epipremni]|nr:hypothetical protein [Actinacidiphila epipremni]